jgi:hypothetical protein
LRQLAHKINLFAFLRLGTTPISERVATPGTSKGRSSCLLYFFCVFPLGIFLLTKTMRLTTKTLHSLAIFLGLSQISGKNLFMYYILMHFKGHRFDYYSFGTSKTLHFFVLLAIPHNSNFYLVTTRSSLTTKTVVCPVAYHGNRKSNAKSRPPLYP